MKTQEIQARLDAIAAYTDRRPFDARLALLTLMGELVDAPRGLYYNIVMRQGRPYSVDMQGMGPQDYVDTVKGHDGTCMDELFRKEDGTLGEVLLDNPFLKPGFSIGESEWFREFSGYRIFFGPLQIRSLLGSYFFIDGKIAGWAGVYRSFDQASFSRRELERVQPHEARLLELFLATCPCDRWQLATTGAVAVLDDQGTVLQTSADAPEWLAQGRICTELRAQAKAFVSSGEHARELFVRRLAVRLTRLVGPDGPNVYVHLTPTAGQPVPALTQLSKRQRAVALALVEGATIAEAARALGMSPETVRSHLKAIYAQFGVSTRVELMKALRE